MKTWYTSRKLWITVGCLVSWIGLIIADKITGAELIALVTVTLGGFAFGVIGEKRLER